MDEDESRKASICLTASCAACMVFCAVEMFSLLSGLLRWLFSKNEVHILVLGLDNAGKTTFLEHSKTLLKRRSTAGGVSLDRIPPTVGLNIGKLDVDNTRVILWDLGGQTILRSIWTKYYSEANGLVFVVDSCSQSERFQEAKETLQGLTSTEDLDRVPFLLCANKQDASVARPAEEVDKVVEFTAQCAGNRDFKVVGTSALTGAGIVDAVHWIVHAADAMGPRQAALG